MIEKCCICENNLEINYEIPFKDLIGLPSDYTMTIGTCKHCGFILNMTPFTEEHLENRYKNLSKYEFDSVDSKEFSEENSSYAKRSKRQYAFIFRNIGKANSVFEVGAASGYNLSLYKKAGVSVFGIEPSKTNKRLAKSQYDVELYADVFKHYIQNENVKKRNYDLIFCSHVLEHIVNPNEFVKSLEAMNQRYFFIEVPTFDYKFSDEPYGMFSDEHVNHFTFESLSHLMKKFNYQCLDAQIDFSFDSYFLAGSSSILTLWEKVDETKDIKIKKPIFSSEELLEAYMKASRANATKVNEIISNIKNDAKLAVWGTGNHTSRLLAMTSLKEKNIVKFYDSDQRKQAYQMQGKEITRFDKHDILDGRIDTILISTYVAQKDILKLLENSKIDCDIICLYDQ